MNKHLLLVLVSLCLLLVFAPAQAATLLPASPWYAVIYQPETDSLHWVNAAGQQATIPRPKLPEEMEYREMRISPDGRILVMVSKLLDGRDSLGIYDLAAGVFLQTHQAQPGEIINLGGETIFTANSVYFAVGLHSGDFANPAWRVILFESQTGNVMAFIDHTHPDAPQVQLSTPQVQYLDGTFVHFQMIPQSVGAAPTWPAFAWRVTGFDPTVPAIVESFYTQAELQVQLLTGKVALNYLDNNYAAPPPEGQFPVFNAIGWSIPGNGGEVTTVHVDASRYHLMTRWAKGGEWILFYSADSQNNYYWNIVLAEGTLGNNSHMPFDPQYEQVYGTSDGYLLVNSANGLYYTNGFAPNTAQIIGQITEAGEVVYVTPIGVSFMLQQLAEPGEQVAAAELQPEVEVTVLPPAAPADDCSLAPAHRVFIGTQARVLPSQGALNVRQQPSGTILTSFAGGTTFSVTGGAICSEGLWWWQIQREGVVGWLAEGTSSGYFIEPYAIVEQPPAPPEEPQQVPPVVVDEAAAEEEGGNEPGCGQAPRNILSVGDTATVNVDTLAAANAPGGSSPYVFLKGQTVTIVAGPTCLDGRRWWMVVGAAVPVSGGEPSANPLWVQDGRRIVRFLH